MMARLLKETNQAKPEGDLIAQTEALSSNLTIGASRRWSGFKNPRIVRVSRTFGGKDRHSKVCTIRGLRDRRIRLSVPTAIQLYDLQERLGLSQPSKVIDWLLEATKLDIDELPPLHFPQFHDQHSLLGQLSNPYTPTHHFAPYMDSNLTLTNGQSPQLGSSSAMVSRKEGININVDTDDHYCRDEDEDGDQRRSIENINEENQYQGGTNFLPSLANNSTFAPYGNLYHWVNPSNLSLSQFGSHGNYSGYDPSMPTVTASLFPQSDTSAATSSAFHPTGSGSSHQYI